MSDAVDEAIEEMKKFIKDYNKAHEEIKKEYYRAHEELKKELRLKLKDLIEKCGKRIKEEGTCPKGLWLRVNREDPFLGEKPEDQTFYIHSVNFKL